MVFRKFLGMIISVSILTIGIGAATPLSVVNFSIGSLANAGINGLSRKPSSRARGWSADFDDQRIGHHVVQAAFVLREADHDEADEQNYSGDDLCKIPPRGIQEGEPLA